MPDDLSTPNDQLKELISKIEPTALRQIMPLTGGVITMMFTDIVDSTKIKAAMGDEVYFDGVLRPHNELVRDVVGTHNGRELKTIGDAFLIGFAEPGKAVACAINIQQRLTKSSIQTSLGPLNVRIGLHTGAPKVYRDYVSKLVDLSGTDVDRAARVESLARGGQVLISEETRTLSKPKDIHDWGLWELKGLGRHRIFEVLWSGKKPERPIGRAWLEPVRFLTQFVGREAEINHIMDAVINHRLVTLKGLGGIGKTRLADEVAARVSDRFEDGVYFVELAQTQNSEAAVVSEVMSKLNINPAGFQDETTALLTTMQNRKALLALDNFEAVMSAATAISKLLRKCPGLHVLNTSQQLLGIDGEQQVEVLPMVAPAVQSSLTAESLMQLDSFRLFRERAKLKKSGWEVSAEEASLVAEILELTDGVPLSIELAAAWVDQVALGELRDGLKNNRSKYLRRSGPTIEEKRHASMEGCIDWSLSLLPPAEKALLPDLSVFVGGFFAEDVTQVCHSAEAQALLKSLHGRSLLMWDSSLGKTRYRMLPTVRDYAAARLRTNTAKVKNLWQRHAQHFLKILDLADDQIRSKQQMEGIVRVSANLENIRAGMGTAVQTQDHGMVVRYSQSFGSYLAIKSRFAELLYRNMLGFDAAQATNDAKLIAGCQNNLGSAYQNLPTGDRGENLKKAIGCYEAALRVYTESDFPVQWAMTQNNLGNAYGNLPTGDRGENLKKAIGCYEAALRVYTEHDFPVDWATTQNNLGIAYGNLPTGDREENLRKAIACYEAALRVRTEHDFPVDWAMTQNNLGVAYGNLPTGDRGENLRKAIACYEAALRVRTEHDFPVDWAMTQNNLGNAYRNLSMGDRGENLKKAIACYEAALRVRTEHDFPVDWAMTQNNLGNVYGNLPTGDRGENLRKAITCYEAAIRGFAAAGLTDDAQRVRRVLASLKDQQ